MIAGGASAHSDHGRGVAEVFLSAARKETDAYKIKDGTSCCQIAPIWMWPPPLKWMAKSRIGILTKSPWKWPKSPERMGQGRRGAALPETRTGEPLYEKWKKTGVSNRAISTVKSSKSCTAPTWAWTRTTKT
jgi:carbon-monoxide dehydrogenase catalytic subunit